LRGDAESQKANDGKNGDKSVNDNDDAKDDGTDPEYDYAQAAHSRGGVDTFA